MPQMYVNALIFVCAASICLNILLFSLCTRMMHWANYWKQECKNAEKPIKPVGNWYDHEKKEDGMDW